MIRKIVFLSPFHFTTRDYKRYGIELLQRYFDVAIWDITPFIFPEVYRNVTPPDVLNYTDYTYIQLFENKNDFLCALRALQPDETFMVSLLAFTKETIFVYTILSRYNLHYGIPLSNAIPVSEYPREQQRILTMYSKIKKILHATHDTAVQKITQLLWSRIPFRWKGVKAADMIFFGGKKSYTMYKKCYPISQQTHRVWCHAFDYDLYLQEKEKSIAPIQQHKSAIFIDSYFPFHEDYVYEGGKPTLSAEYYYPQLVRFFEYVETTFGLRVIIAAHPRSQYEKHPDFFKGRGIVRGKTIELIRSADLVILHSSTATNFAVLFKKPMLFITLDALQSTVEGAAIQSFASYFNQPAINISQPYRLDKNCLCTYDANRYETYKREYIKKDESPEKPFWQIAADAIKTI